MLPWARRSSRSDRVGWEQRSVPKPVPQLMSVMFGEAPVEAREGAVMGRLYHHHRMASASRTGCLHMVQEQRYPTLPPGCHDRPTGLAHMMQHPARRTDASFLLSNTEDGTKSSPDDQRFTHPSSRNLLGGVQGSTTRKPKDGAKGDELSPLHSTSVSTPPSLLEDHSQLGYEETGIYNPEGRQDSLPYLERDTEMLDRENINQNIGHDSNSANPRKPGRCIPESQVWYPRKIHCPPYFPTSSSARPHKWDLNISHVHDDIANDKSMFREHRHQAEELVSCSEGDDTNESGSTRKRMKAEDDEDDGSQRQHVQKEESTEDGSCPASDESTRWLGLLCDTAVDVGPLRDPPPGCSCPRSLCVKLYCDCFRSGRTCKDHCTCSNCENTVAESTHREGKRIKAIKEMLEKNPRAFAADKKEAVPRNPGDLVATASDRGASSCIAFASRKGGPAPKPVNVW
eukprot:CAMPEP_0116855626 /NCGR_PEP_ID=MMETSP0418-20121206/19395_1 /TAXON_ID=1158023 /ORGANISM="Astrosyne radiata, Strain 13vi08-1A" /LENGTH=456 /DNA_ID=CAMNT_0004488805 /DNA_START=310 /DNA_END=1678 /DNA_ORIENTATION=+